MGFLQQRTAAREWYTSVAPIYDPVVSETFWPDDLQRDLLGRLALSGDDAVLDVGCGTGQTTEHVAAVADTVVGIDHSDAQLRRSQHPDADAGVVRADAEHLPVPDETFDAVVSVGAILYFPDPVAALAEARRVTRPGGHVLVAGFNRPELPSWVPVQNWATVVNEALFHTWSEATAHEQVSEAGWTPLDNVVTGPAWHPSLARVVTARTD